MTNNLYRGTKGIEYVSHGAWADPELIYDGKSFNYWDIEEALWDMFCEEVAETTGASTVYVGYRSDDYHDAFNLFVQDNAVSYLEDCIFGGYDYKIVE